MKRAAEYGAAEKREMRHLNFEFALCQMLVQTDQEVNLQQAERMVREAASKGAQVVALPEMFNTPYSAKFFQRYAEEDGGPVERRLASLAKSCGVYLIAGSVPERCEGRIYNTCYVYDRTGERIGKHRKIHLFDVNVKGGVSYLESEVLDPGDQVTIIETEYARIGIAICYDIRFPELFRMMTLAGAQMIVLPASFNMTTGPAHWELTLRARALDNQVYLAGVSPARNLDSPYLSFGNSLVSDPWGEVCAKADSREAIVYASIDLDYQASVREELPLLKQRRPDIYEKDVSKK